MMFTRIYKDRANNVDKLTIVVYLNSPQWLNFYCHEILTEIKDIQLNLLKEEACSNGIYIKETESWARTKKLLQIILISSQQDFTYRPFVVCQPWSPQQVYCIYPLLFDFKQISYLWERDLQSPRYSFAYLFRFCAQNPDSTASSSEKQLSPQL